MPDRELGVGVDASYEWFAISMACEQCQLRVAVSDCRTLSAVADRCVSFSLGALDLGTVRARRGIASRSSRPGSRKIARPRLSRVRIFRRSRTDDRHPRHHHSLCRLDIASGQVIVDMTDRTAPTAGCPPIASWTPGYRRELILAQVVALFNNRGPLIGRARLQ